MLIVMENGSIDFSNTSMQLPELGVDVSAQVPPPMAAASDLSVRPELLGCTQLKRPDLTPNNPFSITLAVIKRIIPFDERRLTGRGSRISI